ncbi:MAG: phage holin family protein [Aquaticitalea sp.]
MNNIFESISNTSSDASDIGEKYIDDTKEYFKLKIFQQLTVSISMVAKTLAIGGLLFIGLIFLSVAAALAIGKWVDNVALGYVIVAAFFFLIGVVLYWQRGIFNRLIIAKMGSKFFNS